MNEDLEHATAEVERTLANAIGGEFHKLASVQESAANNVLAKELAHRIELGFRQEPLRKGVAKKPFSEAMLEHIQAATFEAVAELIPGAQPHVAIVPPTPDGEAADRLAGRYEPDVVTISVSVQMPTQQLEWVNVNFVINDIAPKK